MLRGCNCVQWSEMTRAYSAPKLAYPDGGTSKGLTVTPVDLWESFLFGSSFLLANHMLTLKVSHAAVSQSSLGSFFKQVLFCLIREKTPPKPRTSYEGQLYVCFYFLISEKKKKKPNTAVGLSVSRSKSASNEPRYAVM